MRHGIPFVISAPSGVGKSTLIRELIGRVGGMGFSVSHTTRPPRTGEADGVHYHFVSRKRFEELVAAGEFVEWAEVHGNLYGTSCRALEAERAAGRDVVLDIDVQGAKQVAERVEGAVLIFVLPPSWAELSRRIEARGLDSRETIVRRLGTARTELAQVYRYQYAVINDDLSSALDDVTAIVRSERCRVSRTKESIESLLSCSAPEPDRPHASGAVRTQTTNPSQELNDGTCNR